MQFLKVIDVVLKELENNGNDIKAVEPFIESLIELSDHFLSHMHNDLLNSAEEQESASSEQIN